MVALYDIQTGQSHLYIFSVDLFNTDRFYDQFCFGLEPLNQSLDSLISRSCNGFSVQFYNDIFKCSVPLTEHYNNFIKKIRAEAKYIRAKTESIMDLKRQIAELEDRLSIEQKEHDEAFNK